MFYDADILSVITAVLLDAEVVAALLAFRAFLLTLLAAALPYLIIAAVDVQDLVRAWLAGERIAKKLLKALAYAWLLVKAIHPLL